MTREDRRIAKVFVGCLVFAVVVMWGVGKLMLIAHPLSEADKKCMNKTMLELQQCWQDAKREKQ